jgi:hypothetical protein
LLLESLYAQQQSADYAASAFFVSVGNASCRQVVATFTSSLIAKLGL